MAAKKAAKKKAKPAYLREVSIKYRKRRIKDGSPVNQPLTDAEKVYALFRDLEDETKEKLIAISLDTKLKIIAFEVVSIGSVSAIYTRPIEAVRASIMVNAYGIIILHNHPSGDPTPSRADKAFTKKLVRSCNDLGIAFHDHIIIGQDGFFSFQEEGLM